jgi:putative flippase GtrA
MPRSWRSVLHRGAHGRDWRLIARFVVAGVVNTAFGYAVFLTLLFVGASLLGSLAGSMVAGVAFNFQTATRYVFRTGGRGRIVRFVACYAALLAINWLALRGLRFGGFTDAVGQAMLLVPMAALSFAAQKMLVFDDRGPA